MNFKTVVFFLSHTHTHKFLFQLKDTFSHCLSPFSGFCFQSNPHSEDPLETQSSIIDSIYGLLPLSRAPHDRIDTPVYLSRLFLLL